MPAVRKRVTKPRVTKPKATAAPKRSAAFNRALKLAEAGANGFKVARFAAKLTPDEGVEVLEVFARVDPKTSADFLARAYAAVGRFDDAIRLGKKGKYPNTLHEIGEMGLEAGRYAEAEAAFAAIAEPSAIQLSGIAVAQWLAGKKPDAALARATKANAVAAIDWANATSCYAHVYATVVTATVLAVQGELAKAKKTLADARRMFANVKQKSVRKECDDQLASPADPMWYGSPIARHAGLP